MEAEQWLLSNGIEARLSPTLAGVLSELWQAGYTQGLTQAGKRWPVYVVAGNVALLMSGWLAQIVRTTVTIIAKLLIAGSAITLNNPQRVEVIAITEVNRAIQQAVADVFTQDGVTRVRWVTGGPNPCEKCIANAAMGPHPLGVPFVSGALTPPQHPQCRCHLEKA